MTETASYKYKPKRLPHNVNDLHRAEKEATLNSRFAVGLTRSVGTMWTAYIFAVLGIVGLLGLLGFLNPFTFLLTTWISQQFLQLVLLPVIMVGQNVLNRHSELQAEEQFHATMKTELNIETIIERLSKQDEQIYLIVKLLGESDEHHE